MKVLHLSSAKSWRGGEQQIAYLIDELKLRDIECHIISKRGSAFSRFCEDKNWSYEEANFTNSLDLMTASKIRSYCNVNKIDIVHMHGSGSHGPGFLSAVLGNRSKLVLSRRVDFPLKSNLLSRWKYNHPSIKRIICVSNKIREIVRESINHPSLVETVYSGIDLSKFKLEGKKPNLRSKYTNPDDAFVVGNTSALADHKDYFTFVNTANEVLESGLQVKFLIFGSGPLEKEIKDNVNSKGLADQIIFTGFVENVEELLPQLDLFLMTSKTEGLGTSLLDAMASKVPIVATMAGGIPEIVINGKTGLMSEVGDYKGLAMNVQKVLTNAQLRNSLVEGAFELVQKFDKKHTAEQTLSIYRDLLAS